MREHWVVKAKRVKQHRAWAKVATIEACYHEWFVHWDEILSKGIDKPIRIILTRVGKRNLDSDNLLSSMKAVRDGIADAMGFDDGDKSVIWEYAQRTGRDYKVEVEVEW